MVKKELAWFVEHWLFLFERYSTTYNWQKGKRDYRQGMIRLLEITPGVLTAYSKGLDTHQVIIRLNSMRQELVSEFQTWLSKHQAMIMKIYQGTLVEADVLNEPNHLLFFRPDIVTSCTCEDSSGFCSHVVAVALFVADYFQEDYTKYFIFGGMDWDVVLTRLGHSRGGDEEWQFDDFSLLPVPLGTIRTFEHRNQTTPEFWTSSFPLNRMLEEILMKIREGEG